MRHFLTVCLLLISLELFSQDWDHPSIKNWLINTSGQTGNYYDVDNGPLIVHGIEVNVQRVHYTTNITLMLGFCRS